MSTWLLTQLQTHGDQPEPRFALPATLYWMRALAVAIDEQGFTNSELDKRYESVKRRAAMPESDAAAFERLLMGIHNYSAIASINSHIADRYDVVRMAIVAWYYAIHGGGSAMVRSTSGSAPEDHQKLVRAWHSDIVAKQLAVHPFDLALNSIVEKSVKSAIKKAHPGTPHKLHVEPKNVAEAMAALYAYLSGTAGYERYRAARSLRADKEFKQLGVKDFRQKAARTLRDSPFDQKSVNFLGQAFRYRGKANYRDSIFLSYGDNHQESINRFTEDLAVVSAAFLRMSARYVRQRVEKSAWLHFVHDMNSNLRITVDLDVVGIVA